MQLLICDLLFVKLNQCGDGSENAAITVVAWEMVESH